MIVCFLVCFLAFLRCRKGLSCCPVFSKKYSLYSCDTANLPLEADCPTNTSSTTDELQKFPSQIRLKKIHIILISLIIWSEKIRKKCPKFWKNFPNFDPKPDIEIVSSLANWVKKDTHNSDFVDNLEWKNEQKISKIPKKLPKFRPRNRLIEIVSFSKESDKNKQNYSKNGMSHPGNTRS